MWDLILTIFFLFSCIVFNSPVSVYYRKKDGNEKFILRPTAKRVENVTKGNTMKAAKKKN